jgi:hypothetical protein
LAFTGERDLGHPVSAEAEQSIRSVLERLLASKGLEGVTVNPGLDYDGDSVPFLHLKHRDVLPGIILLLHTSTIISVNRSLWKIGELRPHLPYVFRDHQRILGTEN